ncbi:MAG: ABC transporter ATP-binding protein [Chloroflexi bacterium]|nr:ABC transporter ATP-binding protein [Chloroflexota bacterium]
MTTRDTNATDGAPILELVNLKKYFQQEGLASAFLRRKRPPVRAVDGVSFRVTAGQNFGLVGESGSGKTTIGKTILRLEQPTDGSVLFEGADVHRLRGGALKEFRRATHVVFQDPNSSLSPRMRVRDIVGEPLSVQGVRGAALRERVAEVLQLVGLSPDAARRYPHEFSGGQRQRIAVARAVAADPKLIVLDEPVSALDVSIRAQILNLLRDLQDRLNLTYLMIAHDLAVVYQACDTIGVMYLGKLAEQAPSEALYREPLHPYTRILLSAIPRPDPTQRHERLPLTGEIPSPSAPPPGCRFHPRCPIAVERCAVDEPEWREVEPDHWVACHLV